jgi:hypothetical protein
METKQPHELCPRFEKCGVNVCPLHKNYKKLLASEEDQEKKCTLPKSIRKRLGSSLAWKGLTEREIAGSKRYDNLSPEQKQALKERAKKMGDNLRKSKIPHTNIPASESNLSNNRINDITLASNEAPEAVLTSSTNFPKREGEVVEQP